jgi:hypothetical protein
MTTTPIAPPPEALTPEEWDGIDATLAEMWEGAGMGFAIDHETVGRWADSVDSALRRLRPVVDTEGK